MGSDLTVVNAARVSFDKSSENYSETSNHNLIKYLATHNHWTPFAHCVVTLRETVPIFVARQRFKSTVGFTYNEISRRYVDSTPEFYIPENNEWRLKAESKKQGSSNETTPVNPVLMWEYYDQCKQLYGKLLHMGVAPEQARMVLPQSMYTSYYVTGSLAAWARAYKLRSSEDAQSEIRTLASQWDDIIKPLFPVSWEALTSNG
jgi:thymidylate synthase (FAD)